ncbi:hypothetical protein BS47DRAFT_1373810 [Hydnum rufescens UP504]|uniref:NF-kappa-B-activating protein C-terminal domain-containing protein n=1 Tax=Hydnum rufescens UP504 TaxID=1448309 RepID=A0A9P6DMA3_9AGAM|nr:hypothetical protein BS47DRAFT_1373810 [Hydnum rufescens UP504]
MSLVHPSRLANIPRSTRTDQRRRSRSRSPPSRGDRYGGREGDVQRSRRDDESRDHPRERDGRASPSYADFGRSEPTTSGTAGAGTGTPRVEGSMYPPRNTGSAGPPVGGGYRTDRGGYRGNGGADWAESRRQIREKSTKSIWPPSPKEPVRDESPSRPKSSRRHKRSRSTESDTESSEEDRRERERRRRKKHSSRHHRSSKQTSKHSKSSRHRSSRHRDDDSDSASDAPSRSHGRHKAEERESSPDEEVWVEKPAESAIAKLIAEVPPTIGPSLTAATATASFTNTNKEVATIDDDDGEVGPMPLVKSDGRVDERAYGGALLRGEGSAMAAFVQNNERIPRRGEIGLTSEEIERFEAAGYVMSGSRHRRMNAVRMRKENQVISAEEKRGILKMQKEEKEKREGLIVGGFKEMLQEKLKGAPGKK